MVSTSSNVFGAKSTPATAVAPETGDTILKGVTQDEFDDLSNWYNRDNVSTAWDLENARKSVNLQKLSLTGYPPYARGFEQALPATQAMISGLASGESEKYQAQLGALTLAFENASEPKDRSAIELQFEKFRSAVADEHAKTLGDPVLASDALFNAPFGAALLGEAGEEQADALSVLREVFRGAATSEQREDAFSEAAMIKRDMQQQISAVLDQGMKSEAQALQAARADVSAALASASALEGPGANAAGRLDYFGQKVLGDERKARVFTQMLHEDPGQFATLQAWEQSLANEDRNAEAAENARVSGQVHLPPFKSFTDVSNEPPSPNGAFGENLLRNFQYAHSRMVAAAQRLHTQGDPGGPLRKEFEHAYGPQPGEAEQEANEVFCRLATGAIPGANLFTNLICPKSSLSESARQWTDIAAGVLGEIVGAKLPELGIGEGSGGRVGRGLGRTRALLEALRKPAKERVPLSAAERQVIDSANTQGSGVEAGLGAASSRVNGSAPGLPQRYALERPPAGATATDSPGVMMDHKGQKFISQGGHDYPVTYDKDNGTWRVNDPGNPWRPSVPVKRNAQGEWELNSNVGLPGGAPPLAPEVRAAILRDLRENPRTPVYVIAARNEASPAAVGRIALVEGVQRGVPRGANVRIPEPVIRAFLDDLRNDSNLSIRAAGRRHGISHRFAENTAKNGGVIRSSTNTALSAAQKQLIARELRQHPAATYVALAGKFCVSIASVRKVATARGLERDATVDWSPHVREAVVADLRAHPNDSYSAVARRHDVTPTQVSNAARAENLSRATGRSGLVSADAKARVVAELREDPHMGYAEIGRKHGVPAASVEAIAEMEGLRRADGVTYPDRLQDLGPADLDDELGFGTPDPAGQGEASIDAPPAPPNLDAPLPSAVQLDELDRRMIHAMRQQQYGTPTIAQMIDKPLELVDAYVNSAEYRGYAARLEAGPRGWTGI